MNRSIDSATTCTILCSFAAGFLISKLFNNEQKLSSYIQDVSHRIGEIKIRRTHWPWDRRRTPETRPPLLKTTKSASFQEKKSSSKRGSCIGSIFGLDVGGTLAKLCYFEERTATADELHREKVYREKASAQAVCMARRGNHGRSSSTSNMLENQHSFASNEDLENLAKLRQESVPDDLNLYDTLKSGESPSKIYFKRSRSMLNLNDYSQALDRFYDFARKLDNYREGLRDHKLSFYSSELGGDFHFIRFETRRMENAMELIKYNKLHLNIFEMGGTGGGAHKFADLWKSELGISMQKQPELDSLVAGMQFVLSTVVGECYTFRPHKSDATNNGDERQTSHISDPDSSSDETPPPQKNVDEWWWSHKISRDSISDGYPYLVVTIGTGVSILRVDGPRQYERVSGSTIGGGTYWGLMRLLTDVEHFDDVLKLAEKGDPSKVDMHVGDIYGDKSDALEKLGLPSNVVASSFGKLVAKEDPASGLNQEDLARALLLMITNNIGQVAYLNAKLMETRRIYFVGNFLRHNKISQRRLSYAIDFWSGSEMEALFLEHEGYFGALGAFLLTQNIPSRPSQPGNESDEDNLSGHLDVPPPLSRRNTAIGLTKEQIESEISQASKS